MRLGLELQDGLGKQTMFTIADLPTNLLGEPDFQRLSSEIRLQGWRVSRVMRAIALVKDQQHDDTIAVEIPLSVTRAGSINIEKARQYCNEFQWEFVRLAVDGDAIPARFLNRKTHLKFTANIVKNGTETWEQALVRFIHRSGDDLNGQPLLEFVGWQHS